MPGSGLSTFLNPHTHPSRGWSPPLIPGEESAVQAPAWGRGAPRLWVPWPSSRTPHARPRANRGPPGSAHVGPRQLAPGPREEPGPQGPEAVGSRDIPSSGGRRPPSRSALRYSPRAGAPRTREKRTGKRKGRQRRQQRTPCKLPASSVRPPPDATPRGARSRCPLRHFRAP